MNVASGLGSPLRPADDEQVEELLTPAEAQARYDITPTFFTRLVREGFIYPAGQHESTGKPLYSSWDVREAYRNSYCSHRVKLPTAPLERAVRRWCRVYAAHHSIQPQAGMSVLIEKIPALNRVLRSEEVSVFVADEVSCALGQHPSQIYGESWWRA